MRLAFLIERQWAPYGKWFGRAFREAHRVTDPADPLAWLTDLGHAPAHIRERLRDADVIVVEANYCPQLLEADTIIF